MAHHLLVADCAWQLLAGLEECFPGAAGLNDEAVLFGAATHDIGKTAVPEELRGPGKTHEVRGEDLLRGFVPARLARFALSHGKNVDDADLDIEELLVMLADKLWKGKRVEALEHRVGDVLAARLGMDRWQVLIALLELCDRIALNADRRLQWQAQWPVDGMET